MEAKRERGFNRVFGNVDEVNDEIKSCMQDSQDMLLHISKTQYWNDDFVIKLTTDLEIYKHLIN